MNEYLSIVGGVLVITGGRTNSVLGLCLAGEQHQAGAVGYAKVSLMMHVRIRFRLMAAGLEVDHGPQGAASASRGQNGQKTGR